MSFLSAITSFFHALSGKERKERLRIVRQSEVFDPDWFMRAFMYRQAGGVVDPALKCAKHKRRNPGPLFNPDEYLLLHPDVAAAKLHPLLHYERCGKFEGREISLADIAIPSFPEGAQELRKIFRPRTSRQQGMVAVFAACSDDAKVTDAELFMLEGLRAIADYIIYVGDNPLLPEEVGKLEAYCDACLCARHGEGVFGSYKRGLALAEEAGALQPEDAVTLMADTCYTPAASFGDMVEDCRRKGCDFYGLTESTLCGKTYMPGAFYILSPKARVAGGFKDFWEGVKPRLTRSYDVTCYELPLARLLEKAGCKRGCYICGKVYQKQLAVGGRTYLLKEGGDVLVKLKALRETADDLSEDVLGGIRARNPRLHAAVLACLAGRDVLQEGRRYKTVSKYALREEYARTAQELSGKERLEALFLVNMPSMFPAENVMKHMLDHPRFHVRLCVIPDLRFGEAEMFRIMGDCYKELKGKYDFTECAVEWTEGAITGYKNVVAEADLVYYPSPYNVSYSLYNPYYAAANAKLSFHVNYGFFRSKYDRLIFAEDNYNNFWKVFLETPENMYEYERYGQCHANNAVLTGYAKMDGLKELLDEAAATPRKRKRVIIAPHHSVEGGMNKTLSLSNFQVYAQLFLELPKRYPEVDFVFRPHPVLFTTLSGKRFWGKEKVEAYLREFTSQPNVVYSTEGDYRRVFAESDGIIQDCGSFLVEYFYTGKPCCYMLKSPKDITDKFSYLGRQCLDNCYVAYSEKDIISYMDEVIMKGDDPKAEQRRKFSAESVMLNFPNATKAVVDDIVRSIWPEQDKH